MRTDIFGLAPRQHDMFGVPQETFDVPMTEAEIRRELTGTIDLLRRAEVLPWAVPLMLRIDTMFPEIAGKLPVDEASELIAAFKLEMHRLRDKAA